LGDDGAETLEQVNFDTGKDTPATAETTLLT